MKKLFLIFMLAAAVLAQAVDLVNMPVNTWVEVPNTHLNSVAPSGWSANVIAPWGGAAFDTQRSRLIVWGGGHNDYYGNELYTYEVANERWVRLTDPTSNYATCSDNNGDGTPNSRHTYNGLAYIAHADRFFGIGGALACPNGGCGANKTWTYDFAGSRWHNMSPSGTIPGTCCGDVCAYDPATGKVYFGDSGAWACGSSKYGLYTYDFDNNRWTKLTSDMFIGGMAIDTKRHILLSMGRTSGYSDVYVTGFDLNLATPVRQTWTTTGADAFVTSSVTSVEYDPVADKYVAWRGGAVYVLDPDTKAWTSNNPGGGPPSNVYGVTNGVYGRFRYVPSVNAFIAVVGININVYFYKLTPGMGTGLEAAAPHASNSLTLSARPNPFRSTTEISVMGGKEITDLRVFDIQGKAVKDLTHAFKRGHKGSVTLSTQGMPAGLYVLKASAGGKTAVKTLLLTK